MFAVSGALTRTCGRVEQLADKWYKRFSPLFLFILLICACNGSCCICRVFRTEYQAQNGKQFSLFRGALQRCVHGSSDKGMESTCGLPLSTESWFWWRKEGKEWIYISVPHFLWRESAFSPFRQGFPYNLQTVFIIFFYSFSSPSARFPFFVTTIDCFPDYPSGYKAYIVFCSETV